MNYTIDYYDVLGVKKAASKEDLKAAYRRLAKLHHPDKNPGDPGATGRFRLVQEAYEILSNEITRHVYDEYRAANKPNTHTPPITETDADIRGDGTTKARSRTFARVSKVWREKRIYFNGRIVVKFQGTPEVGESYMAGREQNYKIFPTDSLIIIHSSGLYKDGVSKEYEKAYSSAELFAVPLVQPMRCQMHLAGIDEVYELTVHDLKIKNPIITNISRHEGENFGELEGDCYGYIVHRYEEALTETFTEYYGATGKVETRENAGVYFTREEIYNKDGSRHWGEWTVHTSATERVKASPPSSASKPPLNAQEPNSYSKYFAWIFYLFIALLIWPKLVVTILLLLTVLFFLNSFLKIVFHQVKFVSWLVAIICIVFLFIGLGSLLHKQPIVTKTRTTSYQPLDTRKRALGNNQQDTLISHLVQWHDYDSNEYRIELKILQSAVRASQAEHQSMQSTSLTAEGAGTIYAQMHQMDVGRLDYVTGAFDSIIQVKKLNEMQAAKMMVSCIQSIPYFLIVDQSCTANYNDEFIANYLRNCQNDCCLGNIKFGVQSPAEFIGDLKGDCDTRALALFSIFTKMGYDVALLTSQVYKHAMIAVHIRNSPLFPGICMPIKNNNYYLWETTSTGHLPGAVPTAISNLQYWTISLIHQQ